MPLGIQNDHIMTIIDHSNAMPFVINVFPALKIVFIHLVPPGYKSVWS